MVNDNMAFVNPWWLNIAFFSSGDSITDLNSQKKVDLMMAVLLSKEEGHHFSGKVQLSVPYTQGLLITFWQGWFSSLLRTHSFGFALVMSGTWLSLASAVAISMKVAI